jgi:hypothetical protein
MVEHCVPEESDSVVLCAKRPLFFFSLMIAELIERGKTT